MTSSPPPPPHPHRHRITTTSTERKNLEGNKEIKTNTLWKKALNVVVAVFFLKSSTWLCIDHFCSLHLFPFFPFFLLLIMIRVKHPLRHDDFVFNNWKWCNGSMFAIISCMACIDSMIEIQLINLYQQIQWFSKPRHAFSRKLKAWMIQKPQQLICLYQQIQCFSKPRHVFYRKLKSCRIQKP